MPGVGRGNHFAHINLGIVQSRFNREHYTIAFQPALAFFRQKAQPEFALAASLPTRRGDVLGKTRERAQRFVDGARIGENLGHVGIKQYNVGSLRVAGGGDASLRLGEIILRAHRIFIDARGIVWGSTFLHSHIFRIASPCVR